MVNNHQIILPEFLIITILIAACGAAIQAGTPADAPIEPSEVSKTPPSLTPIIPSPSQSDNNSVPPEVPMVLGFTYHSPSGNRIIRGRGNLPSQATVEVDLLGKPIWIVGAPYETGSIWTVVHNDGAVINYFAGDNEVVKVDIPPNALPSGMPPLVKSMTDDYSLVTIPDQDQSPTTHPIFLPQSNLRVHIKQSGEIQFTDPEDRIVATLNVNALPDARLLFDDQDRILLLTNPTDRYPHGVLGDNLEAGSITLIETLPSPRVDFVITLPDNEVVENISPIWMDITGDSQKEIILTVSDLDLGAGIVVFNENGERLAEGPKMGQPYRWRHQIAFGSFGPNGESELAVVRTPHIAGTIEYYEFKNGSLKLVAEYPGITSHVLGSRNLDMAAAGDFDGDGPMELLLPNPQLTELIAVRRTENGAEEIWRLPLDGVMSTNLAGVTLPDGDLAVGVGTTDGTLILWLP